MVRKLSLGLWRRWSKASRDGSLSENIEKADIRASAKGISTSPDRGSGREAKRERRDPKRASADRSFRASPGASAMASHSISPSVKMGGPEKHFARGICEMRDQNKRLFRGKTVGRELLSIHNIVSEGATSTRSSLGEKSPGSQTRLESMRHRRPGP